MGGIEECKAKGLWCDGILPDEYRLSDGVCCAIGRAWVCSGDNQVQWDFRMELPKGTRDLDKVDWESLLPASNVTKWMSVDFESCTLDLDPGAGIVVAP